MTARKITTTSREDRQAGKCRQIAEVYLFADEAQEKLSGRLNHTGENLDVRIFDRVLDELERRLDDLIKMLNPELQKVLAFLKPRFEKNMHRHKEINWEQVEERLREAEVRKIWSLSEMERTGGEPDVVGLDEKTGELIFQDRSAESPEGRRNCCYDREGEESLKRKHPNEIYIGNAVDMAAAMGVELLTEEEYREAQKVDQMDNDSITWLKTPLDKIQRNAVFFGWFNGTEVIISIYDRRIPVENQGFRTSLRI